MINKLAYAKIETISTPKGSGKDSPANWTKVFSGKLKKLTKQGLKRCFHKPMMLLSFAVHYVEFKLLRNRIKKYHPDRRLVLISLMGRMGDTVACEPIARYIRKNHPNSYIIWCVQRPYRELVESNPNIDKTMPVFCLGEYIYLTKQNLFDEVIDLHFHGRRCCTKRLRKIEGDKEINYQNYYRFGSLLTIFCKVGNLTSLADQPRIYIPTSAKHRVDELRLPEYYMVAHCQSRAKSRDWPPEKWKHFVHRLFTRLHVPVVEIGDEALIKIKGSSSYMDLCGRLSILETAETVRRASVFIGSDSGPAHLANAVGTYGVILLGQYRNFKRYLPYTGGYANGQNAAIIYADGPAGDIPVDQVYQAVEERLRSRRIVS